MADSLPEKNPSATQSSTPEPTSADTPQKLSNEQHDLHAVPSDSSLDKAYKYMQDHQDAAGTATNEDTENDYARTSGLLRRVDYRIVPIMFLCYTMQFIDKVLINYAAVMGLNKDLKLKGNDFTNAATVFFIAYLIAEIPNGLILQKVPVAKWLGFNVVAWGIACACTAAAHNYRTLAVARIFLGMFEAAIAPCLMLLSSMWYTRSEQAPRFSFWYCGLGVGQIVGGFVSFGFQHVNPKDLNGHLKGWQAMFITLGVVTIVIGLATIAFLPDTPMSASWLTEAEKVAIIKHVRGNRTGIEQKKWKWSQFIEVLVDPQIWLLTLITICISISSGVITTYSSTIIRSFGYKPTVAALLNTPSGIVSIIATLAVGFGIRNTSNRWAWIVACCIPGILGGGLLSFSPKGNKAALLAGIYTVNAIVATLTVIYQWTAANTAGGTKRVVSMSLIAAAFSVGNIVGPQTFQARDAPDYKPAKIAVMATQAAGACVTVVLFGYYVWANKKKDAVTAAKVDAGETASVEGWRNITDREDEGFRYVY